MLYSKCHGQIWYFTEESREDEKHSTVLLRHCLEEALIQKQTYRDWSYMRWEAATGVLQGVTQRQPLNNPAPILNSVRILHPMSSS